MDISKIWNELYGKEDVISRILTDDKVLAALKPRPICPVTIEKHGTDTSVLWNDGTVTTVSLCEGDKEDPYAAFCAAYTKKMFGSNSFIKRCIENANAEKFKKQLKDGYIKKYQQIDEDAKRSIRKIMKNAKKKKNKEKDTLHEALNFLNGIKHKAV